MQSEVKQSMAGSSQATSKLKLSKWMYYNVQCKTTSKVLRKKLKTKCTLSEFNFFSTGNFLKVYFFITFYFLIT